MAGDLTGQPARLVGKPDRQAPWKHTFYPSADAFYSTARPVAAESGRRTAPDPPDPITAKLVALARIEDYEELRRVGADEGDEETLQAASDLIRQLQRDGEHVTATRLRVVGDTLDGGDVSRLAAALADPAGRRILELAERAQAGRTVAGRGARGRPRDGGGRGRRRRDAVPRRAVRARRFHLRRLPRARRPGGGVGRRRAGGARDGGPG